MTNKKNICFVHADDWGMIELLPEENHEMINDFMLESVILPEPTAPEVYPHSIAERGITLTKLQSLFSELLTPAEGLLNGYTTEPQPVEGGFAYFNDDFGAIYGIADGEKVTKLCFDNRYCDCGKDFSEVMNALNALAAEYSLLMADFLMEVVVNLSNVGTFEAYIEEM